MSARERTVRFAQDGALGTVTLDSPPLNLIDEELVADLSNAISEVEADSGLRALLLRGEGDVFSAGANVRLFAGRGADEMRPLVDSFLGLGRRVEDLPFPTLAAVHGTCMAGGFELALFCDLIWAAEGPSSDCPRRALGSSPSPAASSGLLLARASAGPGVSPSAARCTTQRISLLGA
jgi:enoyl-CoA hydratase